IVHFFHRDVGSMKVDLRLRWARGHGMNPLLNTQDVASDFKFERATDATEDYFINYFYDALFKMEYKPGLKKSMPGYSEKKIRKVLMDELHAAAARALPVKGLDTSVP